LLTAEYSFNCKRKSYGIWSRAVDDLQAFLFIYCIEVDRPFFGMQSNDLLQPTSHLLRRPILPTKRIDSRIDILFRNNNIETYCIEAVRDLLRKLLERRYTDKESIHPCTGLGGIDTTTATIAEGCYGNISYSISTRI